MTYSNTTVIIPTFNEADNIRQLLKILLKEYKGIKVIVADDGSNDGTQEQVKAIRSKDVILLDRSVASVKGLTAAVVDAVPQVKTKFIVVMDADLQHPPSKVKDIVEELSKDSDVVVSYREKILIDWALWRRITSRGANLLGRLVLFLKGIECKDVLSGFFGAKTDVFKHAVIYNKRRFVGKGYKVCFDLLKQLPHGSKIGHIYYSFGARGRGHSKLGLKHYLYYLQSLVS